MGWQTNNSPLYDGKNGKASAGHAELKIDMKISASCPQQNMILHASDGSLDTKETGSDITGREST